MPEDIPGLIGRRGLKPADECLDVARRDRGDRAIAPGLDEVVADLARTDLAPALTGEVLRDEALGDTGECRGVR